MQKGLCIDSNSIVNPKELLVHILDALCYFEHYGLVYGDIKPQNIVRIDDRYCLIDFDLLPHRNNNSYLTQSFNDIHGYAMRAKLRDPNYNTFSQALYALAFTIMMYALPTNKHYFREDRVGQISVNICGMNHSISASVAAINISRNPDAWIREHFPKELIPFASRLLGNNKFQSFREARADPFLMEYAHLIPSLLHFKPLICPLVSYENATRMMYDFVFETNISPLFMFQCYNMFYRYSYLIQSASQVAEFANSCLFPYLANYEEKFAKDIIAEDKGRYLTEYPPKNVEAKLLLEYLIPGSWICITDETMDSIVKSGIIYQKYPKRLFYNGNLVLWTSVFLRDHVSSSSSYSDLECPSD
jgi:serine/threonine protein kinase